MASAAPHVRLAIVGDGPDRRALERLAARLGLADRVRFVGHVPRADVMRFVNAAAAVVFTGLREEGGIALAEAMLAGAPVIVLAHGGARTVAEGSSDHSRVVLIEPSGFAATARDLGNAMTRFSGQASDRTEANLDVGRAMSTLRAAVQRVCV
jgi:glycosyltransferase involved in cell wall biosynthesis